uniref:Neutral amino acid transporter 9 n=1 Tax=Labrus bergylta TaxID=56723 RepID=A0A3Q3EYL7_9LABR
STVLNSDSHRGSTDSLDLKNKRLCAFHVEPRNIVDDDPQERVSAEAAILNSRVHYYSRLTGSLKVSPPNHVIPPPRRSTFYSPLGTAFAIWNTMMGTSILSIPWGIKQAGFTLGVLLLVFTGLLMLYCCYSSSAYVDTSEWEFPDVCRYYFGKFGQWSSLLFSMVSLIGAMVVYWVLMSNFLYNTGQFIYIMFVNCDLFICCCLFVLSSVICPYPNTDPGGNLTFSTFFISGNETDGNSFEQWWSKTTPSLSQRRLCSGCAHRIYCCCLPGTISVVYLITLVTIKAVRLGFHLEFHWFLPTQFYVPELRLLFPQLTGVLTLAFFIHNCIITLMKSNRNQENNVRDLSVAYLLVGVTYLYVGVLIFAAFPSPPLSKDCIEPNFLDNFPSDDVMVFVARGFLLFQMITVYPLLGYLVRVQMMGQIFGNHYPSFFHVLALNILIVGSGVLVARFYPNIGSIIRFSGATCGLALVFVFPALVHMISLRRQGLLRWPSAVFHSLLIVLGVANLLAQFFM